MTENLNGHYRPKHLTVTRGKGGFYIAVRAMESDGTTPKDLTGKTVTFRAYSPDYDHVIEKTMTEFVAHADDTGDVRSICRMGPFTEADTRGIDRSLPMEWEAQYEDEDAGEFIPFAGGKLFGKGGANRDVT